ncbi:MAG: protein phosphatase 2C domain-containing protein, partial [Deltaproteobacteria bacterium]|nr:protein phosphatase 2C domain-containing protein [Deltaproteobacteria bacterium]
KKSEESSADANKKLKDRTPSKPAVNNQLQNTEINSEAQTHKEPLRDKKDLLKVNGGNLKSSESSASALEINDSTQGSPTSPLSATDNHKNVEKEEDRAAVEDYWESVLEDTVPFLNPPKGEKEAEDTQRASEEKEKSQILKNQIDNKMSGLLSDNQNNAKEKTLSGVKQGEKPLIISTDPKTLPIPTRDKIEEYADGSDLFISLKDKNIVLGREKPEIGLIILIDHSNYREIIENTKNIINSKELNFGKFKEDYNTKLKVAIETRSYVVSCSANNILTEKLGLKVKNDKYCVNILGTPNEGYDGELILKFRYIFDRDKSMAKYKKDECKKEFFIATDPRSMWQDLEVTAEEFVGYPTPNDAFNACETVGDDKIIIVASCRGRSHAHIGKPRDDNYFVACDKSSGWNVMAVSDGAGSARYSRKGSEIACNTSVENFIKLVHTNEYNDIFNEDNLIAWKNYYYDQIDSYNNETTMNNEYRNQFSLLDEDIATKIIRNAYAIIKKEAENKNITKEDPTKEVTIHDYNATLLFLAYKKFSFGYFIISYWIGDGALVLYKWNRQNKLLLLGKPDSGEFAGQTRFLTMASELDPVTKVQDRIFFTFADDFESIIMATDGITDAYFPSDLSLESISDWEHFWNTTLQIGEDGNKGCPQIFDKSTPLPEKAKSLRDFLDFWSVGNHDDRTILIVKDK